MDIANAPYWILEFLKVLAGYVLVQFLWPRFVFARHLSGKSVIYQFSFCITVQTVLINTVVLGFGLVHILNAWTVRAVFWGIPIAVAYWQLEVTEEKAVSFANRLLIFRKRLMFKRLRWSIVNGGRKLLRRMRPHMLEYLLLGAAAVYSLIYLSWGAFQAGCYTYSDQYVHHSWIYGLIEGQIFSGGVYPEAMHCLIYTIRILLGVRVFSIILFLGSIQGVVFLIASYCLCRELFGWRYTPIFVWAAFILMDATGTDIGGMSRMQAALPLEFGLAPQMLCVMHLVRYLRREQKPFDKGRLAGFFLGEDLFLFAMALAAMIASHFYPVIMAFFMCLGAAVFYLRKMLCKERFLPLAAAALCGIIIAVTPMMGALASGVPFQASMDWAMDVIKGVDQEEQNQQETEDIEAMMQNGQIIRAIFARGLQIVNQGYSEVIGAKRATFFIFLIPVALFACLLLKKFIHFIKVPMTDWTEKEGVNPHWLDGYLLLLIFLIILMLLYLTPNLGLPELVSRGRLASTLRVLFFAVAAIPLDFVFVLIAAWLKMSALRVISILCFIAICIWGTTRENYHGYLFCALTRYHAAVEVMESIINIYPKFSYTVVSPTDSLYQAIESGWHEELLVFVQQIAQERYYLPSEHVFIFVEKKPLEYAQYYSFIGPSWLALPEKNSSTTSQAPNVAASEVSREEASKELMDLPVPFECYKNWESRTIIESKAYYWCQQFMELYPNEMDVYYEDDSFVCYYLHQNPNSPFDLAISGEKQ